MAETKEDIAAERDALRAENENLRGQLAAAGASRPGMAAPVQHEFTLSQGQLSDLEAFGVTNVGGRQVTTDDVRGMLTGKQSGLQIADASAPVTPIPVRERQAAVPGVDFVYPSVAPGEIDPAIAGTPGISGPAADSE
jgi:hypothetical protein